MSYVLKTNKRVVTITKIEDSGKINPLTKIKGGKVYLDDGEGHVTIEERMDLFNAMPIEVGDTFLMTSIFETLDNNNVKWQKRIDEGI